MSIKGNKLSPNQTKKDKKMATFEPQMLNQFLFYPCQIPDEVKPFLLFEGKQEIESHQSKNVQLIRTIGIFAVALINCYRPHFVASVAAIRYVAPIMNGLKSFEWNDTILNIYVVVFSTLYAYCGTPLVSSIATALYGIYDAYRYGYRPDPLVEVFYRAVGGKEHYDNLSHTKYEDIVNLSVEDFSHMSRSETPDGRKILIVKTRRENKPYPLRVSIFTEKQAQSEYKNIKTIGDKATAFLVNFSAAFLGKKKHSEFFSFTGRPKWGPEGALQEVILNPYQKLYTPKISTDMANTILLNTHPSYVHLRNQEVD